MIAGQLRAPRRWERLLVEAAVIGGRERWRRRIDGLANDLRLKLAELADEDEARAAIVARTLEDLDAFAGYTLPLIEVLDGLPASAHWGEWLDQLSALATRALRQPDRVLSVLSELAPMASIGPVTLEEVLPVLSDLLLEVAVPPPAQRYGRVFVGPIEAARGLSFEAVFVPGLAEKLFPHRIIEEPILLDAARKQLNAGLATNKIGSRASGLPWRWLPALLNDDCICLIRVLISARDDRACHHSTLWRPCARPRDGCRILPNSRGGPKPSRRPGSVGQHRPIRLRPSTMPSMISPSWNSFSGCRTNAPAQPAIS